MICPKCKNEMRIVGSSTEMEWAETPQETKVYRVLRLKCVNPQCDNKNEEQIKKQIV